MNCGVGRRGGWDPDLLWLWCRLAAIALIRSLAWEPLYATGVAPEKGKKTKKKKRILTMKTYRKVYSEKKHSVKCTLNPFIIIFLYSFLVLFLFLFISFVLPGPHPRHMEVPRLGI